MPDTKPKTKTVGAAGTKQDDVSVVNTEQISGDLVMCRISKAGDGKVATGQSKDKRFYAWKEQVEFPLAIAAELEDRGLLEVE